MSVGKCGFFPDTSTSKYRWPLFWPEIYKTEILQELEDTLSTRWIGQGPKVDEFEQKFGDMFCSSVLPVATNSCTSALFLSYVLADIQSGDKVISTVLTCTATNHALLQRGARIIFCDVQEDTLNADPKSVIALLKKNPDAKAVVVTHLGGMPCDITPIRKYCDENYESDKAPKIICDAAQALGAIYRGRLITDKTLGIFATCFSFQAIKHVTTADGGMLVVHSEEDRERAVRLRWFDIDRKQKMRADWKPWANRELIIDQREVGYKCQMTDVAACFGLVGLRHFVDILSRRCKLASIYRNNLAGIQGLTLLADRFESQGTHSSNWLFGVLVEDRDKFCQAMEGRLIETNVVQVRNDIFTVFGGKKLDYLEHMNSVEDKYVYLPFHTYIEPADIEDICERIKQGW